MKARYAPLLALAFGLTSVSSAPAGEPVVVELFTSQGCSACPAADKLMGKIANDADVIALSWSVSIWDYIGWEDTLAIPLSNERHSWYNRLGGSNIVYTPQIFIDGQEAFVGSHKRKINKAIDAHRGDASVMVGVAFDDSAQGWVTLDFSDAIPRSAHVRIVYFDDAKTVPIGAGENRGRTLTYTNIVRGSETLSVDEASTRYRVDMSSAYAKNCDAFAILVQDKSSGKMLGAAVRRLKDKAA
jgi:hypothetical protein